MADGGQVRRVENLTQHDLARSQIRQEHLLEVETGYRSGSRFWARPDEPRPAFDPAQTTLTERRLAKVRELRELVPQEAKQLGLESISERTLRRMAAQHAEQGLAGLADGRWTRGLSGHASVTPEVEEAIVAVHAESLHRSRMSMKSKERLIHQYVRERFPDGKVRVPHYTTLIKVWREWFGPGDGRQRYVRSAAAAATTWRPETTVHVSRPGQVVVLDTTPLPVKVLDDVFAEPITVHLTIALDACTHSIVAFRLTPGAESAVEVAMLLRDVLLPLPMRPDWGPETEWPYPGAPAALVAELAGHPVAGLPFFAPETVTSDHGAVYKSHHFVRAAATLGIDLLPARAMRPPDKAACERAFAGIQSLLLELRTRELGLFPEPLTASPYAAEADEAVVTEPADEHIWIRVHTALASRHALLLEESYVRNAARWHRITPENLDTVRAGLGPRALLTFWPDLTPDVGAVLAALPQEESIEFVWEAQDGTISHAIVDDTDYQELSAHVADARAACALPLSLAEHHPLLCAALPDSDGVLRARW